MPTRFGEFQAQVYAEAENDVQHMAIFMGNLTNGQPVLTRIHSECLTGDVFGSLRCDCGPQLDRALELIADAGQGVVLYLRQEGRGIGLYNKLRAYSLQERGYDTVQANEELGFPPDLRDYGIARAMLDHLGVRRVHLLTNNPRKVAELEAGGFEVLERRALEISSNAVNHHYLRTKREKMGHLLRELEAPPEPSQEERTEEPAVATKS
ncbi:MAG: GTP cyclohydrolase II [Acidobacteriota bacterium]